MNFEMKELAALCTSLTPLHMPQGLFKDYSKVGLERTLCVGARGGGCCMLAKGRVQGRVLGARQLPGAACLQRWDKAKAKGDHE